MAQVNPNFLKLSKNYLFSDIAKKVAAFKSAHPEQRVISLGIGDVTQPLCPAVLEALHKTIDEMGEKSSFRGYGPEAGYDFLREAILKHDYLSRGVELQLDEIFVNDGAKSDTGNFQEILGQNNTVGVTDPIYPVYVDSNVMNGRSGVLSDGLWSNLTYFPCTSENAFVPQLPQHRVDMIYLCYPNNPTGTVLTREQLKPWVDYALRNDTLILFDAAYEAYISDDNVPHSIYEIPGAKACAVEFRSYSKTAGFTGVRCGYTIVPKELTVGIPGSADRVQLNPIWNRRQSTKFNGASYLSQRAAEAIYSNEGKAQVRETIAYYMENARLLRTQLEEMGFKVYGGRNAPYLWVKTPGGESSWDFFDSLLHGAAVVCTPGSGFGPSGDGYFRLTAFGNRDDCREALQRIKAWKG